MRSVNPASPLGRAATAATCVLLVGGIAAGCSTTQEKAEHQAARATHILKARAERQRAKKRAKHKDGKHGAKHGKNGKSKDSEGEK